MVELTAVFRVVDLVGVVLNGIIGGTIARRKRFDAVGFVVLAIISALGGGVVRDLLIGAPRPAAVDDPAYLVGALAGAAIAFFARLRGRVWRAFFVVADSVVLGAWAATGTAKSLSYNLHWLPALLLGVATAVGGGMIRDVTAGRVPEVFGGNNLYATPAVLSSAIVLVGYGLHAPGELVLIVATLAGGALTAAATARGWHLPVHGDGTYTAARARLRIDRPRGLLGPLGRRRRSGSTPRGD